MSEMNLKEFLGHKANDFADGSYLKNWKKAKPPVIDVWLHMGAPIASIWQHGIPYIKQRTDRDTQEKTEEVWSGKWTCWEDESILQKQNRRDRDTGLRLAPPTICPVCLLIEWVREQVESGDLDWTKPLFRFEAKDGDPVLIRAGGFYNAYARKEMTAEELASLKKAKVDRRSAWQQNGMAKLSYVFAVVDNDAPDKGVVVTTEPGLLGDRVKEVIHKAMMSAGDETGNPFRNPYCIRWIHKPDEQEFNKKYDACRMEKIQCDSQMLALIRDTEAPTERIRRVLSKRNPITLRANLEQFCLVKGVPWDALFGRAEKEWEAIVAEQDSKDTSFNTEAFDAEEAAKPAPKAQAEAKVDEPAVCEECGELVPAGAPRCPGCGAKQGTQADPDDLPY